MCVEGVPRLSIENPNDLSADGVLVDDQHPNRNRQFESPRASTARIEIKYAVPRLQLGNVSMARDDNLESRRFRLQVKLGQIVQHVDGDAAEFNDFGFWKLARPRPFIDVATDRGHRRKGTKFGKNFGISDVAGVNNLL